MIWNDQFPSEIVKRNGLHRDEEEEEEIKKKTEKLTFS